MPSICQHIAHSSDRILSEEAAVLAAEDSFLSPSSWQNLDGGRKEYEDKRGFHSKIESEIEKKEGSS
jgi:hypothetical protein